MCNTNVMCMNPTQRPARRPAPTTMRGTATATPTLATGSRIGRGTTAQCRHSSFKGASICDIHSPLFVNKECLQLWCIFLPPSPSVWMSYMGAPSQGQRAAEHQRAIQIAAAESDGGGRPGSVTYSKEGSSTLKATPPSVLTIISMTVGLGSILLLIIILIIVSSKLRMQLAAI